MRRWLVAVGFAVLLVPCAGSVQAADGQRRDPLTVFVFGLKIDGLGLEQDMAFFRSVGGLQIETAVVEVEEGGFNSVKKLPGRTKFGNLILTRAFHGEDGKDPIQQWIRAVEGGQNLRKKLTLTYYRKDLTEAAHYELFECFPVRWEVSELDASKNEIAIESIEIAHEGLVMIPPK